MKHRILMIGFGFVWACSGDPKQQGARDRSPGQADVQATAEDMSRDNGSGHERPTDPVVVNDSGNEATSEPANAGTAIPPLAAGPTGEEDASVTPPHKVTGAYLVGTILPHEEGEAIKVGLVAKAEDKRLSLEPDRYETTWSLATDLDDPTLVKLAKSSDENFDRVLEFNGSEEEFLALQSLISVQVNVAEGSDETNTLHSVVTSSLSELLEP